MSNMYDLDKYIASKINYVNDNSIDYQICKYYIAFSWLCFNIDQKDIKKDEIFTDIRLKNIFSSYKKIDSVETCKKFIFSLSSKNIDLIFKTILKDLVSRDIIYLKDSLKNYDYRYAGQDIKIKEFRSNLKNNIEDNAENIDYFKNLEVSLNNTRGLNKLYILRKIKKYFNFKEKIFVEYPFNNKDLSGIEVLKNILSDKFDIVKKSENTVIIDENIYKIEKKVKKQLKLNISGISLTKL